MRRFWALYKGDILVVLALITLWWVFFWRIYTPVVENQVSLVGGDFSDQFVTFGAYQYERWADGEVPLWNPYNNGGLPFIADTQAAVFYPPRLITIALSSASGTGWTYGALAIEMTFHVLFVTLAMYAFIRRLTMGKLGTRVAGFVSAVIIGYGGYMTGYPPLQLALLEAAVWLPLGLLGILEATRIPKMRWLWLVFAGFALGLSWMAGHPQTSFFSTYVMSGFLAYRIIMGESSKKFQTVILGIGLMGVVTFGITAVQLLPGVEYLSRTIRAGLSFEDKGNGFPFYDVIQVFFPHVMSQWSPLYIGVVGFALALLGLLGRERDRWFWLVALLLALGLSFGASSGLFHALFQFMPGLYFFRGQERAAFVIAHASAILAGLGVVMLYAIADKEDWRYARIVVGGLWAVCQTVAGLTLIEWINNPDSSLSLMNASFFSLLVITPFAVMLLRDYKEIVVWAGIIPLILVFELFSANIDRREVYEILPPEQQLIMQIPPLVAQVKADRGDFRVDGQYVGGEVGIYGYGNSGSLYQLEDIRGISPLFLDSAHAIIQRGTPFERVWEVFAVKYVFTDAEELPAPSELIGRDYPDFKTLNLHQLTDPRPFALLVYQYEVMPDDESARARLNDPDFNPRDVILLDEQPLIELPTPAPESGVAGIGVIRYAPEHININFISSENALLSVALVDYPGWRAEIDGVEVNTLRAYGAMIALPIEAGVHVVTLTYDPLSYRIGAIISIITWAGCIVLGLLLTIRQIRKGI
jgi:hypothetical protein